MTTRAREGKGGSQDKKAAATKPSPPSSEKPIPNYLRPTISSTLSSRRSYNHERRDKPPSHAAHLRPRSSAGPTRTPPHASTRPTTMRSFSSLSSSFRSNMAPMGSIVKGKVLTKASPANSSRTVKRVVRSVGPRSVTSESSVEFEPCDKVLEKELVPKVETRYAKNECVALVAKEREEAKEETHGDMEERLDEQMTIKLEHREKKELLVVTEEQRSVAERNIEIKVQHFVALKEERSIDERNIQIKTGNPENKQHLVVTEEERSVVKTDTGIKEEHYVALKSIDNSNREIKTGQPKEKEHVVVTEEERSVEKSNTTIRKDNEEKEHDLVKTKDQERMVDNENEEIEIGQHENKEHLVISKWEINIANSNVEDCVNKRIGEEVKDATKMDEKHVVEVKTTIPAIVKENVPSKQIQPRKKEITQAYNDVIEETASKLMENKRNKVRALAGAFETVISLQDTK